LVSYSAGKVANVMGSLEGLPKTLYWKASVRITTRNRGRSSVRKLQYHRRGGLYNLVGIAAFALHYHKQKCGVILSHAQHCNTEQQMVRETLLLRQSVSQLFKLYTEKGICSHTLFEFEGTYRGL
jgi:hypothetical protein